MKRLERIEDLAVFSGAPAFEQPLHVGRPNIGNRERLLGRIGGLLDRRWLSNNGPLVRELEAKLGEFLGVKHCICVCNATVGLEIAINALGLKGRVIVPSFTFIATAHALRWQGIEPVFCDIDPATHNLDPAAVERRITPDTTGIIGVHVWGRACPVEDLEAIARRRDLVVLYDAAHAFACSRRGRMIGGFGRAEVFSFHATKFFNTFEGGAITTNDDELAARLRLMRNFGFAGYDDVVYLGTNGKMTEVCAAMGLTNLEELSSVIETNGGHYRAYRDALATLPGVEMVEYDERDRGNFQYVIIEIGEKFPLTRDELMTVLHADGVLARRYFHPGCHAMQPYALEMPDAAASLPHTDALCRRVLSLPTGSAVSAENVAAVCAIIRLAAQHGEEVRRQLEDGGEGSHG